MRDETQMEVTTGAQNAGVPKMQGNMGREGEPEKHKTRRVATQGLGKQYGNEYLIHLPNAKNDGELNSQLKSKQFENTEKTLK
ncbi:hypothetical protein JTB14_027184 [Gonioctena quinquepunctata]|nr:hypothetical protein JTB14_027184 [Gonioctena quinquepunctata]